MDTARARRASARSQRGWAGLIGLLIALAIVAWLGRGLLAKLLPAPPPPTRAGARAPGPVAPADFDATTTTPVPRNELERAKGLENAVRDQAADMARRIEDAQQQPPRN